MAYTYTLLTEATWGSRAQGHFCDINSHMRTLLQMRDKHMHVCLIQFFSYRQACISILLTLAHFELLKLMQPYPTH